MKYVGIKKCQLFLFHALLPIQAVYTLFLASNPCQGAPITCDTTLGGCTKNSSDATYCFCNQGYQLNQSTSNCTGVSLNKSSQYCLDDSTVF